MFPAAVLSPESPPAGSTDPVDTDDTGVTT
jgi:hypothetical protein